MGGNKGRSIKASDRKEALKLINEAIAKGARMHQACKELNISIRTLERWIASSESIDARTTTKKYPRHKLTDEERAKIIFISNSKEFRDLPPGQIVPKLADRGEYIASESSFYRVFKVERLNTHRGRAKPKTHKKPNSYIANNPNEVWSWDITYLATNVKGKYFYLYLILDIFSRKIVGFEVYENESAKNAAAVASAAYRAENINGNNIILHSDNGSPMKGATMIATLQNLGVTPSFSRPSVSNDNPYSEAIFKTLKYNIRYPKQPFTSLAAARNWVFFFVHWYNNEHKHSAIKFVSPRDRHQKIDVSILKQREKVYADAISKNPSRWSTKARNWDYIKEVRLNPGKIKNRVELKL